MAKLMHTGSVKDFYVIEEPTDRSFGKGYLYFKQRPDGTGPISIFDLKERFPFGIKGKDKAIYDEAVHFFELKRERDTNTLSWQGR